MKIYILSGSFHAKSKSLLIANFIKDHLKNHDCEIPQLDSIPFYSEDITRNKPDCVQSFLAGINDADAIICVTPEYNHSVPAVLKNAIDWASRPAFQSPLKNKPVAIITQADSPVGGARAQAHLKLILDSTLSVIFPSHEMMIAGINKAITENGEIVDPDVRRRLIRYIEEFLVFTEDKLPRE